MKDIPLTRGRRYIASLVAEGEHERQDFKYSISDARKIARSISAFANHSGGRLLIGVKDNGVIAGVRNEEDAYVVELAATRYCDPPVQVEFAAYSVDTGIVVISASIAADPRRPIRVIEQDGRRRAYYRVADENIVAHPLMVRAWVQDTPVNISLDDDAAAIIDTVRAAGPDGIQPEAVALATHLSNRRAGQLITSLASYGILSFAYHHPHFTLIITD